MVHKLKIPAAHGGKDTEVTVDLKTARRMLKWVNAATRPEDLMQPPEVLTHLHVEYRKRGFPERHPPVHEEHERDQKPDKKQKNEKHGKRAEHADHVDEKLAAEILDRRNENPVYGFL